MVNWKSVGIVCLSFILCLNCVKKKTDSEPDNGNTPENIASRQEVLTNYADNIILPAYVNFSLKLDTLVAYSNTFTSKPDSTSLSNFRQKWQIAYIEWQKVELFDVGPTSDYGLRSFFNAFPTRITQTSLGSGIEENIQSGNANLDLPSMAFTQGFPALDYLLFGLGNDSETLTKFTTDADASKRLDYVKRITDKMKSVFGIVHSEWKTTYRDKFVSNSSLDAGAPFSLLINGILHHYEKYLRSGKFGDPSGAITKITFPNLVEAYYKKDISLTLGKTAHKAFVDLFNGAGVKTGKEGASLKSYLNAIGAKDAQTGKLLSVFITEQFTNATNKMNLLTENLSEQVVSNNQGVQDVYLAMRAAASIMKVDMVSALSITITYTDTDGD